MSVIELKNGVTYAHPNDPRVLVTSLLADFKAVVNDDAYAAAILTRDDAFKNSLAENFSFIFPSYMQLYNLSIQDGCAVFKAGHFKGTAVKDSTDFYSESAATALDDMVTLYNSMSGVDELRLLLFGNPARSFHPHHYDVLNCSIFDDGTIWKNEQGDILQPGQGNLFYFKAGFEHASPQRAGSFSASQGPSLVMIVSPLERS